MGKKLTIAQVKLKKAMDDGNVSDLSRRLGVTRATLYRFQNGESHPENMSIGLCRSLKNELGIYLDDWFEEVEE